MFEEGMVRLEFFAISAQDSVEPSKRTLVVPLGAWRIIDRILVARVRAKLSMLLLHIGKVVVGIAVSYGEAGVYPRRLAILSLYSLLNLPQDEVKSKDCA